MITEGKARLIVKERVFYNPLAKLSRDIGIAFLNAAYAELKRKLKVCEPLAATGIRGIRYAMESDAVDSVLLNDKQKEAFENIIENIKINSLESIAKAENKDANLLLEEHAFKGSRFDFIDIDPYGSPVKFIQPAIRSLAHKGYLAIAATDTAALCGVAKKACIRKYSSIPLRNEFMHETGIRILIAATIRIAAFNEVALEPLLCHSTMHYMRVYFRMYVSSSKADMMLNKIGYLAYCGNCLWRSSFIHLEELPKNCLFCGSKIFFAGPLWLGELIKKDFVSSAKTDEEEAKKLLDLLIEESEMPAFHYDIDQIASKLKISGPKINSVIESLKQMGFKASKTHFARKGIRTDADIKTLYEVIRRLVIKA